MKHIRQLYSQRIGQFQHRMSKLAGRQAGKEEWVLSGVPADEWMLDAGALAVPKCTAAGMRDTPYILDESCNE